MIKDSSKLQLLQLINDPIKKSQFITEKESQTSNKLSAPQPNVSNYWETVLRGLSLYPQRLNNFIQGKDKNNRLANQKYFPYLIDIEPNSRCNFRCTMCQVSEWARGQRARDMTLGEFESLQELFSYVVELKIHGMGEPLLHKEFFNMLSYLEKFSIWTRTSINGSLLLVNNNIEKLIQSNLGEVQISIDGASKETYEKIRVRANFEKVCKGVAELNSSSTHLNRDLTRMWVMLQKENIHELEKFVELAHNLKFKKLTFSLSLNDWGQEVWRDINGEKGIEVQSTLDKISSLYQTAKQQGLEISLWRQANKYSTEKSENLCPWIFDRTYITSDMRLTPCAIIGNPEVTDLGGAQDILKSWNGDAYLSFREKHLSGNIPNECQSCYKSGNTKIEIPGSKQVFVNIES